MSRFLSTEGSGVPTLGGAGAAVSLARRFRSGLALGVEGGYLRLGRYAGRLSCADANCSERVPGDFYRPAVWFAGPALQAGAGGLDGPVRFLVGLAWYTVVETLEDGSPSRHFGGPGASGGASVRLLRLGRSAHLDLDARLHSLLAVGEGGVGGGLVGTVMLAVATH